MKAVDSILGQAHNPALDLRRSSRLATRVAEQTGPSRTDTHLFLKVRLLPCLRTTQEREQIHRLTLA